MKRAYILSLILIIIILAATVPLLFSYNQSSSPKEKVFVGVAFGGNSTDQAKQVIDKVKGYTNVFVLDSGINKISLNETASREVCDYAIEAGLDLVVNMGSWTSHNWPWQIRFLNDSRALYGDKFLGCYFDDEPGGIPLDWNWTQFFSENQSMLFGGSRFSLRNIYNNLQVANATGIRPDDYNLEAKWFNNLLSFNPGHNSLKQYNITSFTSDYALYWFDYLGGYDTIFAQIGWNSSINTEISLIRGAAKIQDKEWGAIITWKYTQPPYLDTGSNVYDQMVTAYNGGAKYILFFDLVFDASSTSEKSYSTMAEDHFQALKKFWNQVVTKQKPSSACAEAALVLPNNYGWGMRKPDDKIWGFWGPDNKSPAIWNNSQLLVQKYGLGLDIVYEDPKFPLQGKYSKVYYWNQTL